MDLRKIFMNEYEAIIMINPKLKRLGYIKGELLDIIGELNLCSYEDLGNKRLAYDIKRENIAHYIKINFYGDNKIIEDLEEFLKIDNNILKFLTMKIGERKDNDNLSKELYKILDVWTNNSWVDEPLDTDEVNLLVEYLRLKLNLINGNLTEEEYKNIIKNNS